MKRFSLLGAAGVLVVMGASMGASPVLAQNAPAGGQSPAPNHGPRDIAKDVEAHIAMLHSELKITPAEEGRWAAFAQVMRENAAQMDAAFSQRGAALGTMNAAQNLQSYAEIARVQSADMQKLATAFQTLYASFPAAQQKLADEVFRERGVRRQ